MIFYDSGYEGFISELVAGGWWLVVGG